MSQSSGHRAFRGPARSERPPNGKEPVRALRGEATTPAFVARWDLDKTYLRTDFDTIRDLVRTAVERPDQKRTVPGAAALMRELGESGGAVHILSGSPEQLRGRLIEKLRIDGVRFESLTLKPNLQNIVRLRFRALRGQLGYKLSSLLRRRCELPGQYDAEGALIREVLLGDDAEADAFVYSLYADICSGQIEESVLTAVMRAGRCYEDDVSDALRLASYIPRGAIVQRILIHLERQTSPYDFEGYGERVVPFYNYFQAAIVLFEDRLLNATSVIRVAQDLAVRHHFDGDSLARSYLELARRGHVAGTGIGELADTLAGMIQRGRVAGASELSAMMAELEEHAPEIPPPASRPPPALDYLSLVAHHNRRTR